MSKLDHLPHAIIFQTTELDHAIAEEFFGWRWLAYVDTPIKGTPGYPAECRIRRFFPPAQNLHKQWAEWFAYKKITPEPANGDEPLAYCYCSSNGPHFVPHFSGDMAAIKDLERELQRRKLWEQYQGFLAHQSGAVRKNGTVNQQKVHFADCEARCIAALATIGSKYVIKAEAEPA